MTESTPLMRQYQGADKVMWMVNLGLIVYALALANWLLPVT